MGPVTGGLLCQQQKYLRDLHNVPDKNLDLTPSFPRLRIATCLFCDPREVAGTTLRQRTTLADLAVEIFKPMRFEELQSRCRPCAGGSFDMLCVFGVNPGFTTSPTRNSGLRRGGNLLNLGVAEGAGILPPSKGLTEGRPWHVASCGTVEDPARDLCLALKDRTPTSLTTSTIEFFLECMEFGRASVMNRWGNEPHLDLECYPSVFATFVTLVSVALPPADGADGICDLPARSRKASARSFCDITRYRGVRRRDSSAPFNLSRGGVATRASPSERRRLGIRYLGLYHACSRGKRVCPTRAR